MLDESLKKNDTRVVGIKQTRKALENGSVSSVIIAKDADARVLRPIMEMCRTKNIKLNEVSTMSELGKACGIEVGAAAAAILND